MSNDSIDFSINRELAEKFTMALKLNHENSQQVITRFMQQYVSKTFSRVSEEVTIESKPSGSLLKQLEKTKEDSKITIEMVAAVYSYAKKVYHGKLTRQEGKVAVARATGMNEGSAQDYITDFLAMMEGKEYRRAMCNYGTAYYLEKIRKDYGEAAFKRAILATEKHINYYNGLGYGQLKTKERIVNHYKKLLK